MVKKGDLIEFKAGLFGIQPPDNYGIYLKRYRNKKTKSFIVELYTLKGIQKTSQSNIYARSLGKSLQLKGDALPDTKTMKERLKTWIQELQVQSKKMQDAVEKVGKVSEFALWKKLQEQDLIDSDQSFTLGQLASIWYELDESEISRKRIKKLGEELKNCIPKGQGFFELVSSQPQTWKPIDTSTYKKVKAEISELGHIRNMMFQLVEVQVEDSEDPEETEMVKLPVDWENIHFNDDQQQLIQKLQDIMAYFVEYDNWPDTGLGGTHIYALEGFSLRTFLSHLAEDWVNEGRTSYADAFVKFLIKTKYWTDSDALLAISKLVVRLAPNFEWETDPRIEEIAARFKEPKDTPGSFDNRLDLRSLEAYTIDPPTAKDFDDAVSLDVHDDGYVLWVHIADVAHYVEKDSSLDLHARRRATSVYLPTKTLPMLPTHLSDNLCSLREQVPRLAMSVEIHYDKKGNKLIDKCKVHNTVIEVNKNLTYDYVNDAIARKEEPFYSLHQFSLILQSKRRGLNLETDDVRLELGGQMALSIKTSSDSTKMIESFMVAANETVAEILLKHELPGVFRNHPLPDRENVRRFNAQAKVIDLNYEIEYPKFEQEEKEEGGQSLLDILSSGMEGGNITFTLGSGTNFVEEMKKKIGSEEPEPQPSVPSVKGLAQLTPEQQEQILKPFREVIELVEKIEDEYERKLGYLTVLRTLSRAIYGSQNMGHFGLGSVAYLHFTSPIRRYPDVIAHRLCKAMIAGEDPPYTPEEIEDIALHCTEQSEVAERLEKTIVGAGFSFLTRNPAYTENRMGVVISIFGGGVYVLLPNGIEARIPISKITDKPTFVDDYETMCFVGSRSDFQIVEELTPDNWKDMLKHGDDPIDVITKIGDKIAVEFIAWNHVEGKVEAAPISIYERVGKEFVEKPIEDES